MLQIQLMGKWGENFGQAYWEDDLIFFCPTSSADADSEDLSFIHVLCQSQGDRLDYTCRKAIGSLYLKSSILKD